MTAIFSGQPVTENSGVGHGGIGRRREARLLVQVRYIVGGAVLLAKDLNQGNELALVIGARKIHGPFLARSRGSVSAICLCGGASAIGRFCEYGVVPLFDNGIRCLGPVLRWPLPFERWQHLLLASNLFDA